MMKFNTKYIGTTVSISFLQKLIELALAISGKFRKNLKS